MAEMMAFNRRHTPRHGDTTMENRRYSLTPAGHAAADPAAHSSGDQAHPHASVVMASAPKSHSKKRRDKPAVSLKAAASATVGAPGGERKMSGAQLRLFFLLCVALYFSVIFFADDIVRFAKWMSDEDPVRAWQAPSKPPVSAGRTTPKPAQPPGSGDRKAKASELLVVKGATQGEKKAEDRTGNLRGGDDAKAAEKTTKMPEPREEATPVPMPTVTREGKTGEKQEPMITSTVKEPVDAIGTQKDRREKLPHATSVDEDAPLESAVEDRHKARVETTTDPDTKAETETAAVPAQIPELGLTSSPSINPPKADEEGARLNDADADSFTRLPETPQLIQAT